nr:retrovirus-related Pol polyprotein from transposon TNT 1-94 [Tanacetum cinerariifolium]
MPCVTSNDATPKVLACAKYAIDVQPILPRQRNNMVVSNPLGGQCPLVWSNPVRRTMPFSCSKHMTEDRLRLKNFMKKFVWTFKFGNDHFGAIMGYGDYVLGDSVISRVYYVEGLGHNLFSVEVVATACYTQNRSLIHILHNETPYELVHDKKPDLSFLCVFGALYYPINDSEDLGKLKAKVDIGLFVGYASNRKCYRIYTTYTISVEDCGVKQAWTIQFIVSKDYVLISQFDPDDNCNDGRRIYE